MKRTTTSSVLLLIAATAVAFASARDYAGGWNDGSRLATVESVGDRGTLVIDDSIFVRTPADPALSPYPADEPALRAHGTLDKLVIDGHFYSDKPPLPSVLLGAVYALLRATIGLKAALDPAAFCYWMTLASAGLPYVIAVWCVFRVAIVVGLASSAALSLTASFALATVALPYSRHVNGHIVLLAVVAALQLGLLRLGRGASDQGGKSAAPRASYRLPILLGLLSGLAYTIDLGAGPVVLLCTFGLVAYRLRDRALVTAFVLGALPAILAHHAITLIIAGTLAPPNTVTAYFEWPGSPFTAEDLTGVARHSAANLFLYATALLIGKRGFLGHNLPLFLAVGGLVVLLRSRVRETPELWWAAAWMGVTWLLYAYTSNNYSGVSASIRWFVPFLAPAYLILAVLLRENPRARLDLMILSGWGVLLGLLMWREGPWMNHMIPLYWPIQVAALATWGVVRWRRRMPADHHDPIDRCRVR